MARPLARTLVGGAAAAVLAAPILLAAPAQAATAPETVYTGATGAFALRLNVNLPSALAPLAIDLQIDPTTGTVSTVNKTATASAQVLGSDKGLIKAILDAAPPQLKGATSASLAAPGPARSALLPDAAGLGGILSLGAIESTSQVSATSSSSTASVARIGLALGDQLAQAAAPLTAVITAAQAQLLSQVASGLGVATTAVCQPLTPALTALLGPLGLSQAGIALLCDLPGLITRLSADLTTALENLGDNIFGTGLIQTSQSISKQGNALVSKATASVAGLQLLGQPLSPVGAAGVLQSSAEASANSVPGQATAKVTPPIVASLNVGGLGGALADLRVTLQGLLGSLNAGTLTAPLTTIIQTLLGTVNGLLAPLGASVITLDDSSSAVALASCPTTLTGLQKGTFTTANGRCAAAATRGIGVEITLPAALATPLGLTGPFITLALAPSAAVAQAGPAAVVAPEEPQTPAAPPVVAKEPLARTGMSSGILGGTAIAALVGAAYLRRRRLADTA